jgi:hypothetical protein
MLKYGQACHYSIGHRYSWRNIAITLLLERQPCPGSFMEGVPFVGNDACAHNLLLKGRPLIMR